MASHTPPQARNFLKRSLWRILDPAPKPSEVDSLWAYFESTYAYCGSRLDRDEREGHCDHVIPTSAGGTNDVHNHVLACGRCNGDERRESEWDEFLCTKAPSPAVLAARREKILQWLSRSVPVQSSDSLKKEAEDINTVALGHFDKAVLALRKLRENAKK